MGGVGTFGVVACVQEVAVTPGELLADADRIHYTVGASEKDEEEAIRKASDHMPVELGRNPWAPLSLPSPHRVGRGWP